MTTPRRRYLTQSREYVIAAVSAREARGVYVTALESVYLRDSGLCWLCHEPVEWSLPVGDLNGPSLDHVIPKSRGGHGLKSNLRLAHRSCNAERGAPEMEGARG